MNSVYVTFPCSLIDCQSCCAASINVFAGQLVRSKWLSSTFSALLAPSK